jgi:Mrp family chromosome partitioning ATPase
VHTFFGIKPKYGLGDYLTSEMAVEELLIHPGIERFVILPTPKSVDGSSELLALSKMVQLVQDLRTRYSSRLIIFDLPPVLVGDDVAALSPLLDAILLVVEDGKTQADELARAVELLEGVNLLGTVLNKSAEIGYDYAY